MRVRVLSCMVSYVQTNAAIKACLNKIGQYPLCHVHVVALGMKHGLPYVFWIGFETIQNRVHAHTVMTKCLELASEINGKVTNTHETPSLHACARASVACADTLQLHSPKL